MVSTQDLEFLSRYRSAVTSEMKRVIGVSRLPHYRMMRYHMGWETVDGDTTEATSGKMLRPTLCLLSCEAVGGDWYSAVPAAAGIEILHNFSLVHDDIEDQSHERHGRPTVWDVWGEAQAINVGDGMFVLAQQALLGLTATGVDPAAVVRTLDLFQSAAARLCEGQHRDMSFEGRLDVTVNDYLTMISGKTGALIETACTIGASLGGATEATLRAIAEYGRELGRAFQIYDDYLGIWGDSEKTGKPTHDDIVDRKKSFPVVFALAKATGADATHLRQLYNLQSGQRISISQVEEILEIFDRLGAGAVTLDAAREAAERAISAIGIDGLDAGRRRELQTLVTYVVDRSS